MTDPNLTELLKEIIINLKAISIFIGIIWLTIWLTILIGILKNLRRR